MARRATRGEGKAGFTLLETMVAAAIGFVLLAILMRITIFGVRTMSETQRHLDALHSGLMQLERVEQDLHHMFIESVADLSMFAGQGLGPSGTSAIHFRTTVLGPGGRGPVYVGKSVEYRAVPAGNGDFLLARNGEVSIPLRMRSLRLDALAVPSLDGHGTIHCVRTVLVAVDPDGHKTFEVRGLTAIDAVTLGQRDRFANPNPDGEHPAIALAGS